MKNIPLKLIRQEQGSTLVVFLFILAAMAAVAVAALQMVTLNMETSEAHKKGKNAFYSAEAGLDLAVNDIITEFENLRAYTDSGGFTTPKTYRGYQVSYNITNPVEVQPYQTVVGNSIVHHYAHTFDIETVSTSNTDLSTETLNETIRILKTPLVQYYAFYGGTGDVADLEINPGPEMDSWGRMHANGDIYLTAKEGLNLRNYDGNGTISPLSVVAGGNIYKKNKATNSSAFQEGEVTIKTTNIGTNDWSTAPKRTLAGDITSSNVKNANNDFNDVVLIQQQTYQVPGKTRFLRNELYEQRAQNPQHPGIDGIKIVGTGPVGRDGIRVYVSRPTYTEVTALVAAMESSAGVSTGLANAVEESLSGTSNTPVFKDCREYTGGDRGRQVDFTDIDLNLLQLWYEEYLDDQDLSLAGDGILIYASRSPDATFTNSSGNLQAIRLMKLNPTSAPQLSDKTTLATDNPIYIQGDFNTISTKGVALIGDAINILSNNFEGKDVACSLGVGNDFRHIAMPDETSVNAAFFAGNVPTPGVGNGSWSGGLNNYPRFHEHWGKSSPPVKVNISGCFINLWKSTQAIGEWGGITQGISSPPIRNWGWDVRFQDPDFWPPFIPSIFSVERVGFLE